MEKQDSRRSFIKKSEYYKTKDAKNIVKYIEQQCLDNNEFIEHLDRIKLPHDEVSRMNILLYTSQHEAGILRYPETDSRITVWVNKDLKPFQTTTKL